MQRMAAASVQCPEPWQAASARITRGLEAALRMRGNYRQQRVMYHGLVQNIQNRNKKMTRLLYKFGCVELIHLMLQSHIRVVCHLQQLRIAIS